jgi:hypothetical protein
MFGGVGYLMNGAMVFGIHKQALVIRTSQEKAEEFLKQDHTSVFDITGRPMRGWVLVFPEGLGTEKYLSDQLHLSFDYVKTLPKK